MRGFTLVGLLALSAHVKNAENIIANTAGTKLTIETTWGFNSSMQKWVITLDSFLFDAVCLLIMQGRAAATDNATQGKALWFCDDLAMKMTHHLKRRLPRDGDINSANMRLSTRSPPRHPRTFELHASIILGITGKPQGPQDRAQKPGGRERE
jgi:hypothetical protein